MIICDQHIRLTRGRRTVKAEYLVKDPSPGVGVRAACGDHLLEEVEAVKKRHEPGTVDVTVTILPSR